ncbi:DUF881 domain-containing protein [Nocardioides sp.]|uniref:DUF881 domain-containing protein n=1 Tax=Nocardioides sp. TaxID=35761 RepID=UPI0027210B3F|nr:DUF881 domain-containing protein [Nocardioides sp.]MDO9455814.1 DUF881 domain-containing protein [Nocardioides sp.]
MSESESGRSRLARALRRPSRSQAVVGVLLALVGFAGVTQIRTNEEDSTYSGLREQDLIDVLNGLAGTTQRTQAEIDRLSQERQDLLSETTQREAALERTRREVDSLNVLAGLVAVTGPGVRVTIAETTGVVKVSSFLDVIQELRSVGAEAIQVNGQVRLVAQTSFEQGTGGIVVDGTLVEPPYVVDAIGDANVLAGAMVFSLGPARTIREEGGELTVEELASIDISTTREREGSEFAEPDP